MPACPPAFCRAARALRRLGRPADAPPCVPAFPAALPSAQQVVEALARANPGFWAQRTGHLQLGGDVAPLPAGGHEQQQQQQPAAPPVILAVSASAVSAAAPVQLQLLCSGVGDGDGAEEVQVFARGQGGCRRAAATPCSTWHLAPGTWHLAPGSTWRRPRAGAHPQAPAARAPAADAPPAALPAAGRQLPAHVSAATPQPDGSWLLSISLPAPQLPGLLRLEVQCGALVSAAPALLLVSEDAAMVSELGALAAAPELAAPAAELLRDLGLCLEARWWLEHQALLAAARGEAFAEEGCEPAVEQPSRVYSAPELWLLVGAARRLACAACAAGWAGVLAAALPLAAAGCGTSAQLLARLQVRRSLQSLQPCAVPCQSQRPSLGRSAASTAPQPPLARSPATLLLG
jgi:hypothetical protein